MKNNIYRDTLNFFYNQYINITIFALIISLINFFLYYLFSPNMEQLISIDSINKININFNNNLHQIISQLSTEQQKILLQNATASTIANLISNVILSSGLLIMIRIISSDQPINIIQAIILSMFIWPRLSLLMFIITVLVQIGLLFILPGILFAIILSFSIVFLVNNNYGILKSIYWSMKLSYIHINKITPVIFCWLIAKAILLLLTKYVTISFNLIFTIFLNLLSYMISSFTLIYLYRIYDLFNKRKL